MLKFDVQWIKKDISGQKHCFDAVESCCKTDFKIKLNLRAPGCLNLTGSCHFSNLWHVCSDSFHTLQCHRVSRVEMEIYERSLPALLSLPCLPLSCFLSRVCFLRYPQMESLLTG